MDEPLRIVALKAENVKRLRAVSIFPDPNLVIIGGRNGQGKTSLLDSIWWALGGKHAQKNSPQPIRSGESSAAVSLNLGALVVERLWNGDGSSLIVRASDGSKLASPQSILDALTGAMAFDPLAFANQPAKAQREVLLGLVDLPFDIERLEADRQAMYEQRSDANRRLKAALVRRDALPASPDLPAGSTTLLEAIRIAQEGHQQRLANRETTVRHDVVVAKYDEAGQRLRDAQASLVIAEEGHAAAAEALRKSTEMVEAMVPDPDIEQLEALVTQAQRNQEGRLELVRRGTLTDEIDELQSEVQFCEEQMREADETKRRGLANAQMPIDCLGFGETEGITYRGLPFSQASHAEKLRVSTALAMAGDPKIRVVIISDGSLLDDESLAMISEMAVASDFQVWIERVGDGDRSAIVIEDGSVAE